MIHLTIDGIPAEVEKGTTISAGCQTDRSGDSYTLLSGRCIAGWFLSFVRGRSNKQSEEPNLIRHVHFAAQR